MYSKTCHCLVSDLLTFFSLSYKYLLIIDLLFRGLIYYPEGALNVDGPQENMSEMFRPYYSLLSKIRNLLLALTPNELFKVGPS